VFYALKLYSGSMRCDSRNQPIIHAGLAKAAWLQRHPTGLSPQYSRLPSIRSTLPVVKRSFPSFRIY